MQDGKYVILYLDDDKDFLDSMRVVLETNGYVMVEAETAEEGLKVYKETQPDLIIADLMMEEVDAGTSFVKELRLLGDPPPIYMLSSVGDNFSISMDYSELGLAGIFQKPVDNEHLLSLLRTKLK